MADDILPICPPHFIQVGTYKFKANDATVTALGKLDVVDGGLLRKTIHPALIKLA